MTTLPPVPPPPLPIGTRIQKTASDPQDHHQDGSEGVIADVMRFASVESPYTVESPYYMYVVRWDDNAVNHFLIGPDRVETLSPSIVCPLCRSLSYHPRDIAEKYCGRCHAFHSRM